LNSGSRDEFRRIDEHYFFPGTLEDGPLNLRFILVRIKESPVGYKGFCGNEGQVERKVPDHGYCFGTGNSIALSVYPAAGKNNLDIFAGGKILKTVDAAGNRLDIARENGFG
jgi:hypothetical protein